MHTRNAQLFDDDKHPALTAGCLFSGMGGFASGLSRVGFEVRWASDNNEFACAAFRHLFPLVRVLEKDVCELSVQTDCLTSVDLLAAGFPCQSFSQAGDRRGFEDPRGALFSEIPRLIEEYRPEDRPALIVLENVPHLLYGENGEWFDRIRRDLRRAGYWFRDTACWTVNVKDVTHLPQDRERLFMVAASRKWFARNPFSPPSPRNGSQIEQRPIEEFIDRSRRGGDDAYLPLDNRYHKMISKAMVSGESEANIYQLRRSYVREKKKGLCPTLTANMGVGGHNVPFVKDPWGIRRLSIGEVARLQGYDITHSLFPEIPETEKYRLLGNAVCVGLARLIGSMCADILNARGAMNG